MNHLSPAAVGANATNSGGPRAPQLLVFVALAAVLAAVTLHAAAFAGAVTIPANRAPGVASLAVTSRPDGWPTPVVGVILEPGDGCAGLASEWPTATDSIDLTVPADSTIGATGCPTPGNNPVTAPIDVVGVNYTDTRVDQPLTFAGGSFPFGLPAGYWIWRTLNPDGTSTFRGLVAISDLPDSTGTPTAPPTGTPTPTPTDTGTPTTTPTPTDTGTPTPTPTPTDTGTTTPPTADAAAVTSLDAGQYTVGVLGLGMVVLLLAYHAVKAK